MTQWEPVVRDRAAHQRICSESSGRRAGHTVLLWKPLHLQHTHTSSHLLHVKRPHQGNNLFFFLKWAPVSLDLSLTSAPTCTHLPTFFSHWGMTITRYQALIKVDDWHEQRFKGAINQQAQAQSSLQLPDGGPHRRSLLKNSEVI